MVRSGGVSGAISESKLSIPQSENRAGEEQGPDLLAAGVDGIQIEEDDPEAICNICQQKNAPNSSLIENT